MNQHTPQEWADITGCYVAQDSTGYFFLYEDKPVRSSLYNLWQCRTGDRCCLLSKLINVPDGHDWTTLYEPRKADNAPHQSEVFIHQEYKVIPAQASGSLNVKVNQLLAEGWKLYGSPFSRQFDIYQAMVRGV